MTAGPTPKGVSAPRMAKDMTQAITTIASQTSFDQRRA
jgi:hypothetical protein